MSEQQYRVTLTGPAGDQDAQALREVSEHLRGPEPIGTTDGLTATLEMTVTAATLSTAVAAALAETTRAAALAGVALAAPDSATATRHGRA